MKSQSGRSMVEMLGVLAIIGVLSVGAIAGYSKAMFKYKLNQHAQAVNMLINNVLSLKGKLQHNPGVNTYFGTLLYKLNMLPDGIEYGSDSYLKDKWFKERISIYYSNDKYTDTDGTERQNDLGAISFYFDSASASGEEICRNIAFAAKENAANIYLLQQNTGTEASRENKYYGDAYCTEDKICLRNLDINKVAKICNNCSDAICTIRVVWK